MTALINVFVELGVSSQQSYLHAQSGRRAVRESAADESQGKTYKSVYRYYAKKILEFIPFTFSKLACTQGIAGYQGYIPVAVKTLSTSDPEVVRKFMEEAELMKKFSHPNIVSLLGKNHILEDLITVLFEFIFDTAFCRYYLQR